MKQLTLLSALLLLHAPTADAVPILGNVTALVDAAGQIWGSPSGEGPTLAEKGLTVTVRVVDRFEFPVAHFPWQDIWLGPPIGSYPGTLDYCPSQGGLVNADYDTDANGTTTLSGPVTGGGWSETWVSAYISGMVIQGGDGPLLPISINNPDINGDRVVNLADVGLFVTDVLIYHFRSDFVNAPGAPPAIDLSDVAIFASQIGAQCP